jgi:NADH-quinone oxidoreductase subunit E
MTDNSEHGPPDPANPMAFAMAWTAFGLGMTAHMLGAMSQAFASAGQGGAQPKPAAKAAEPVKTAAKETAKVLSFETASKAKSSKAAPAKSDDLKLIPGIGPKLEQLLNKLGISTLAQIAGWTKEDADRIDAELNLNGRVLRDDWAGHANKIAKG